VKRVWIGHANSRDSGACGVLIPLLTLQEVVIVVYAYNYRDAQVQYDLVYNVVRRINTRLAELASPRANGERPRLNSPLSLATLHYQNPFEYL
jgi:hypothetical protein